MTAIIAQHYRDNYEALAKEPIIRAMAWDLIEKPDAIPFKVAHDDGRPTWEFMQAARGYYWRQHEQGNATVEPESIGAVAEAILLVKQRIEKSGRADG